MGEEPNVVPVAFCVFRDARRILLQESRDPLTGEKFHRPLGGTIEPGERSRETVVREMREELGAEVKDLRFLGVVESLFTFKGERRHEIQMIYEGAFADRAFTEKRVMEGREDDGRTFKAEWLDVEEFRTVRRLYPEGLLELL